jgi:hypothetical protein
VFDFTTKTSPTVQWKVDDFSKWFKNPAGLPIASNETVPLTHYKVGSNEPAKVDKDVFGNNIINNQKDFKADYMNRSLPEKYAYGLDRKGQGDLAYEQLDIEEGDDNELSRAREEFYEQYYLKAEHGINLKELQNETQTLKKEISQTERGSGRKIRQVEANEKILVETIPNLLGKNLEKQDDAQAADKYLKLKYTKNRQLTQKEIIAINKIFREYGLRPVPIGTYSHAVAQKLNSRLSQSGNDFDNFAEREAENKRTRAKSRVQRELRGTIPTYGAGDGDGAGGGGASESKRSEPEYQDEGQPLPKRREDEDDEDDDINDIIKHKQMKARF